MLGRYNVIMHLAWHVTRKILLFVFLAAAVAAVVWWRADRSEFKQQAASPSPTTIQVQTAPSQESINKKQYSVNDPASLWAVVNKGRVLPSDYIPANLTSPNTDLSDSSAADNMHLQASASAALEKLVTAAKTEGLKLMLGSGYRSYATQSSFYSGYVSSRGQAFADSTSARAGHSEHQTGLAADVGATSGVCQLEKCFGDTPEGQWLAANAYKYGFIVRYPKDKQSLTGYDYEPWHLRYVGAELAAEINKSGQTLEQFFDLPAYSDYPANGYQLKAGN